MNPLAKRKHRRAEIVVDLGFGDAGKGTTIDYLARGAREEGRPAHHVVRFNGGAQAGHNVITENGLHHTFSQFGAATFVPGVKTLLSSHTVVHPQALMLEARALSSLGVVQPLSRICIDERALVITPYHQASNRLRELARGAGAHGTCGVGVGETVADSLAVPDLAIHFGDLYRPASLPRKLRRVREYKRHQLGEIVQRLAHDRRAEQEMAIFEEEGAIECWVASLAPLISAQILVGGQYVANMMGRSGTILFEGAQGVLLDEWRGFHPHTTYSTCTPANARSMLKEFYFDSEVRTLGVLRSYATRHGQGPFPTESPTPERFDENHNTAAGWQGGFRIGALDIPLLRYAIECCALEQAPIDALCLTHVDRLEGYSVWPICHGYRESVTQGAQDQQVQLSRESSEMHSRPSFSRVVLSEEHDLQYQERLGKTLNSVTAEVTPLELGAEGGGALISLLEQMTGLPIAMTSSGPRAQDKRNLSRPGS